MSDEAKLSTKSLFQSLSRYSSLQNIYIQQECIPVGCLPSASVAVTIGGRGGCLPLGPGGCLPLGLGVSASRSGGMSNSWSGGCLLLGPGYCLPLGPGQCGRPHTPFHHAPSLSSPFTIHPIHHSSLHNPPPRDQND